MSYYLTDTLVVSPQFSWRREVMKKKRGKKVKFYVFENTLEFRMIDCSESVISMFVVINARINETSEDSSS